MSTYRSSPQIFTEFSYGAVYSERQVDGQTDLYINVFPHALQKQMFSLELILRPKYHLRHLFINS
jgi:predicted RNase H-like nuclease